MIGDALANQGSFGTGDDILGRIRQASNAGRLAEATALLEEFLQKAPQHAEALHLSGVLLCRLGHVDKGRLRLTRAVALEPRNAVFHFNLGNALKAAGDSESAIKAYEQAIYLNPRFARALNAVGNLHAELENIDRAEAIYRQSLSIDQSAPVTFGRLVALLERSHRLDEALNLLQTGLSRFPGEPFLTLLKARCLARTGRQPAALELAASIDQNKLPPDLRCDLAFELGKLLDQAGKSNEAFSHFLSGNLLLTKLMPPHQTADLSLLSQIDQLNSLILSGRLSLADRGTQRQDQMGAQRADPVFLVGFPRSGTTLLGQILQSHPDVVLLDEKPTLHSLVENLKRRPGGYPASLCDLPKAEIEKLRHHYFDVAAQFVTRSPGTLLLDKLPLATVHLGLIAKLFPKARIIFLQRHPLDVVLSCFMQRLKPHDAPFLFTSLEKTAKLFDRVMALKATYDAALPLRQYSLRYEDLVDSFEPSLRNLLAFLGLEWSEGIKEFHRQAQKTRGGVGTPSYDQVTQPLYGRANRRWRAYREPLHAASTQLAPWITAFGYQETEDLP